ncbi:peptidoglycan endopeptidase [Mycolicibacterium mucogenicum]|uniref:Peptidoglycan endopeptidase n=2 Tax=Mycolicibacterium mucogenicum TaxID=56689 RepID=A0A4R5WBV8_MYCMU|nr:peptidoglycan endopeptidase [Mycolicibacterium mucogenicum]TDK86948.1 peptidoglycan endopeptidase [Mycolicibacterium mucogenicum]
MFAIATASLLALVNQVSGTPYISGGDTARGTDCSGLASWVANAATGRPVYGNRFNTGNEEAALRARGFLPGTAPGALNIGWNGGHTAVTLPDGTPVSSGEGGGVRVGGGGAFQRQFTHHMHLPMAPGEDIPADLPLDGPLDAPLAPPAGPADLPTPEIIEAANFAPAPEAPAPAPEAPAPAPEAPAPAPEGPEMPV